MLFFTGNEGKFMDEMVNKYSPGGGKNTYYVIGGIIAAVILIIWITSPARQKSYFDASISGGYQFKGKSADLRNLGMELEGQAPGSPIGGTGNASGADSAYESSLFKVRGDGLKWEESSDGGPILEKGNGSPDASASAAPPGYSDPQANAAGKNKLSMLPALTANNAGTSAAGSIVANKFFGTGNTKQDMAVLEQAQAGSEKRKKPALASLQRTMDESRLAALSRNFDASKQGASAGFENLKKSSNADLYGKSEELASEAGLEFSKVKDDYKKNDPNLNKKKVTLPEPEPEEDNSNDQMFKQMLLQMLISSILGPIFGGIFNPAAGGV